MADNTIVVAHLSDDALKNSINSLVNEVDKATKTMAENFNAQVKSMEDRIRSLGTIKVDSGGASDGGSSRRAASLSKEKQAVEGLISSYDMLAQQLQRAVNQANRRYSANDEILNLRANLTEVEAKLERIAQKRGKFGLAITDDKTYSDQVAKLESTIDKLRQMRGALLGAENADRRNAIGQQLEAQRQMLAHLQRQRQEYLAAEEAARQLRQQQGEITQQMAATANAATQVTSEYDKQLSAIKAIRTTKDAKQMFIDITKMSAQTLEQMIEKGKLLVALLNEVKNTPLMSANNVKMLEKAIGSLRTQAQAAQEAAQAQAVATSAADGAANATSRFASEIAKLQTSRQASVLSMDILGMPQGSVEEAKAKLQAIQALLDKIRNTPLEKEAPTNLLEKRLATLQDMINAANGITAAVTSQEAAEQRAAQIEAERQAQIKAAEEAERRRQQTINDGLQAMKSVEQQLRGTADYTEQINGVKQMKNALSELSREYNAMQDKTSPRAQQLENEIGQLQKNIKLAERYNFLVAGFGSYGDAPKDTIANKTTELQRLVGIFKQLSVAEINAASGNRLVEKIQAISRELDVLNKKMKTPASLDSVLNLPTNSIDDITYKIQMLQSYVRGVNSETAQGAYEIRVAVDEVDKLTQKAKDLQKTTKQIQSEANAKRFENISSMSETNYDAILRKTREMYNFLKELRSQPILDEKGIKRAESALAKLGQSLNKLNQTRGTTANVNSAMSMTANTLDEIAKKMQRLQAIRANLNLTTQRADIDRINQALGELSKKQDEVMQKSTMQKDTNNALSRSWNYMKNRLAFYFTVGASTQFVKTLVEIRGQYEMVEKSLGILIQSAERGSQVFNELSQMALVSPYTLIELSTAAKQLVAYDVAAKDVVETTRRLADMTAAVGVPVERLTYALGQIKAYGYLNARDARMFSNTGIPLVKELSNYYTELEGRMVSVSDVYDRIKKKAIGYNDVMSVINKITDEGGRFFNYQAKVADTLKVKLANLTLAWNNMLNDIGKESQGALSWTIGALRDLFLQWKNIDKAIWDLIWTFGALKAIQLVVLALNGKLASAEGWKVFLGGKLQKGIMGVVTALKSLATWQNVATAGVAALVLAGVSLITSYNEQTKAVRELNEELKKNAREASQSIGDYVDSDAAKSARELAQENQLSATDGKKAWEGLREELEKSSLASASFMSELMAIEDVNARVSKGFEYADKIRQAQEAMQGMNEETIKFTKDLGWGGMFGEGLASDLQDYIGYLTTVNNAMLANNQALAENYAPRLERAEKEFNKELDKTVKSVQNFLTANEIEDPFQIKEVLARVKAQIIAANPEMTEAARQMFSIKLDEAILGDADDTLAQMFFKRLKSTAASAFQDIDDDWLHSNEELEGKQQKAIQRVLEYFKSTMPQYADAIQKMVDDLNDSGKLRLRIGVTMGTRELTDFQRDMQSRINMATKTLDFGAAFLDPQESEDLVSWAGRLQDEIKKLGEANKHYKKDDTDYSRQQIKDNERLIQQMKNRLDLYNQSYTKDKETKKDVLGEAISKEVQLVGEMQKRYKEYRKMGVDANTAVKLATDEYRKSLENTNRVLRQFGINAIDTDTLATLPLQDIKSAYEAQLAVAQQLGNTKGVEALEKAIASLNVEIKKIDYKAITDGLNNELSKLKNEYELAVELDANPELGNIFADMMGISEEDIAQLPRDAAAVAKKAQEIIQRELREGNLTSLADTFDIGNLENIGKLNEWLESAKIEKDSDLYKGIRGWVDFVNKIRLDETKKQIEQWDKLLEKYAEYETKRKRIMEEAERERNIATQKGASQEIIDAINNRERRELAQLDFEEFQKSPEWITATGDLAGLTDKALGMLIKDLEEYKKKAKNLDPKQIKQLNKALSSLYKQHRSGNPFHAIADAMDEARERAANFTPEIQRLEAEIQRLSETDESYERNVVKIRELQEELAKLKEAQEEVGKVSPSSIVSGINDAIAVAAQATQQFEAMAEALGGTNMTKAKEVIHGVMQNLQAAANGAAIGAQIGGGWGAAIGAVAGGLTNLVTQMADKWSGNRSITKKVQQSEDAVKRLELAYIDLEHAINDAYGMATIGAQKAAIANKELQLAELKRQLQLEQSRKKKNRDEDRIIELQKKINELEYEIQDSVNNIVNDLLGISSVGDAMENLMGGFIEALRNGEDAMAVFDESVDDMIANMVKKMFTTKILQPWFEEQWNLIEKDIDARTADLQNELKEAMSQKETPREVRYEVPIGRNAKGYATGYALPDGGVTTSKEEAQKAWADRTEELSSQLTLSSMPTLEDIKKYAEMLRSGRITIEDWMDYLDGVLTDLDLMKDGATDKTLSALQQGIQGITENTAGALEAYMNGVSQQVYYHSTLLEQIRNAVVGFDIDIQTATMGQMLLQLQQSYQVQMSIQNTLAGWSNASGQAVRVEMV